MGGVNINRKEYAKMRQLLNAFPKEEFKDLVAFWGIKGIGRSRIHWNKPNLVDYIYKYLKNKNVTKFNLLRLYVEGKLMIEKYSLEELIKMRDRKGLTGGKTKSQIAGKILRKKY